MENTTENDWTEAALLQGLVVADEAALQEIYRLYRRPLVRMLTSAGASEAAGNVFFQTGLMELARQLRQAEIGPDTPLLPQLRALVWAHYTDWLAENNQPAPETPEALVEQPATILPDTAQMQETRRCLLAWRRPASAENPHPDDPPAFDLYQKIRHLERSLSGRDPVMSQASPRSRIATYVVVGLIFSLIGAFAYRWIQRSQTPAEVYKSNFQPPKSILEDIQRLNAQTAPEDTLEAWPADCNTVFETADALYRQKEYTAAAEQLMAITDLEEEISCRSDALFYLGIIGLQIERPTITLQCFSKIDNLERYGEDLYWYQALAFVKIAAKNPSMRDKAVGAVERARSNTQDAERRAQADKMLEELK